MVQYYAPELKKRLDWYKQRYSRKWHLDEMYVKVKGEWKYLYRAIDEGGNTMDFYLSHRRNAKAAKRFLSKLIRNNPTCDVDIINTDKNRAYSHVTKALKHGKLKRLVNLTLGFQLMKTAYVTIKGFEIMRMFKKG